MSPHAHPRRARARQLASGTPPGVEMAIGFDSFCKARRPPAPGRARLLSRRPAAPLGQAVLLVGERMAQPAHACYSALLTAGRHVPSAVELRDALAASGVARSEADTMAAALHPDRRAAAASPRARPRCGRPARPRRRDGLVLRSQFVAQLSHTMVA